MPRLLLVKSRVRLSGRLALLLAVAALAVGLAWVSPGQAGRLLAPLAELYTEQTVLLGPGAARLHFADLNRDGWQDALTVRSNQTHLQFNQGGAYGPAGPALPGELLFVLDIDQDGDYDLVVNRYGSGDEGTAVLLNDGQGNFFSQPALDCAAPNVRCLTGDLAVDALPGDLDNDGDQDLVVRQVSTLLVYLNQGNLDFQLALTLSLSGAQPGDEQMHGYPADATRLGDLDLDGDLDLAVITRTSVELYPNDGRGRFIPAERRAVFTPDNPMLNLLGSLVLGDVDGDRDLDLLFSFAPGAYDQSQGARLLRNQGNAVFEMSTIPVGNSHAMALGDLDRDGDLDLVLTGKPMDDCCTGTVRYPDKVLYNDSTGYFSQAADLESGWTYTPAVALVDSDNDGNLDIALAHLSQTIVYITPAREGAWSQGGGIGSNSNGAAAGDLDGDGDLDVVRSAGQMGLFPDLGPAQVYFNNGFGEFPQQRPYYGDETTLLHSPRGLALGDVDGDGDLDLAAAPEWNLRLFQNDGAGNLTMLSATVLDGPGAEAALFADLDGDGDLDLAVEYGWYRNEGPGGFTQQPYPQADLLRIAAGDLDGDGDPDLVGYTGSQVIRLLNNGLGNFTAELVLSASNLNGVAIGDLDGDTRLDIAVVANGAPNYVLFSQGETYQPVVFGSGSGQTVDLALGDLENDGDLDIVTGAMLEDSLAYYNDGLGGFSARHVFQPGQYGLKQVSLADLDGDGDLDALTANNVISFSQGGLVFRRNLGLGAQPAAPLVNVGLPGAVQKAVFLSSGEVQSSGVISIPFTLKDPQGDPAGWVWAEYSTSGGGAWQPAIPAAGADLIGLATQAQAASPFPGSAGSLETAGGVPLIIDPTGSGQLESLVLSLTLPYTDTARLRGVLSAPWPAADPTEIVLFDGAVPGATGFDHLNLDDGAQIPLSLAKLDPLPGEPLNQDTLALLGSPWTVPVFNTDVVSITLTGAPAYLTDVNLQLDHTGLISGLYYTLELITPSGKSASIYLPCYNLPADYSLLLDDEAGSPYCNDPIDLSPLTGLETENANGTWFLRITTHADDITFTGIELDLHGYRRAAPLQGSYRPAQALNGLRGLPVDQPLSLLITDTQTGQSVLPQSWGIAYTTGLPQTSLALLPQGGDSVESLALQLSTPPLPAERLQGTLSAPWPPGSQTRVTLFDGDGSISQGYNGLLLEDNAPASIQAAIGTPQDLQTLPAFEPAGLPTLVTSYPSLEFTVTVDLPGSYLADLDVQLSGVYTDLQYASVDIIAPDGDVLWWAGSINCTGSGAMNITLDDEAPVQLYPGCPGWGGSQNSNNRLKQAEGKLVSGQWTVRVTVSNYAGAIRVDGLQLDMDVYSRLDGINGSYRPRQALSAFQGMPLEIPLTLQITDTLTGDPVIPTSWAVTSHGRHYVFPWDTFASSFFGDTDNLVFRVLAAPDAPLGHVAYGSASYPFRARGTQVRVVENGTGAPGSVVYQLPAGRENAGAPIADSAGRPQKTDARGYLPGRGVMGRGDRLFAMQPVTTTEKYTLYHTNGQPGEIGVTAHEVTAGGVQTLTVSSQYPLLLFDLDLSLEWDAHQDTLYLEELQANLQRASEYLYDFTDGQVALGKVDVYQNREKWTEADITVLASNRQRPWAVEGGVLLTMTAAAYNPALVFGPGQLSMGATWNRYGTPGLSLGEDWPLILAHELGHYLLFLDDVYLGLDDSGQLIPVRSCTGSAMGDLYSDPANSEFIFDDAHWQAVCGNTLAAHTNGMDEWAVMNHWYPALQPPAALNSGPGSMPFDFTEVTVHEPPTRTNTLVDPSFYVLYADRRPASSTARAYLVRGEQLVNLGAPAGGQSLLLARGAQPGERLCVFDSARLAFGCETIAPGDDILNLKVNPTWNPQVSLTPVTSTTLQVVVSGLAGQALPGMSARLFLDSGHAGVVTPLVETGGVYSGTVTAGEPALNGAVQVYVDEPDLETNPRRETILPFAVGGNPGLSRGASGGGGQKRSGNAPLLSPDGNLIYFTPTEVEFPKGTLFNVQSMAGTPPLPAGRGLIGQAYRILASEGAVLPAGSVSIQYLQNDVTQAGVDESDLRLYFYDGTQWIELKTTLDAYLNLASAPGYGPGVYALLSSIRVGLAGPGWTTFAYPLRETRPVTVALASVEGAYTNLYTYEALDGADPWKRYTPGAPGWANDLRQLDFGQVYYLYATQPVTAHFGGSWTPLTASLSRLVSSPPSGLYGEILASPVFTPTAGMLVTGWVNGHLCGQTAAFEQDGRVRYILDVRADSPLDPECGAPGRLISVRVDDHYRSALLPWDDSTGRLVDLAVIPWFYHYFPVIR